MSAPGPAPKNWQQALAELDAGCDSRGVVRYGLPATVPVSLVHFGSCTANPTTWAMLAAHERIEESGAWHDPRDYLKRRFGAEQCALVASGTDAEYACALAMCRAPFASVLMDTREIGSGCSRAAAGLAHSEGCPVVAPLPVQANVEIVPLRTAAGAPLAQAAVDASCFALAERRRHQPLLLHHVPCSKTGLCAPSESACLQLQGQHGAPVRVVVDASQGRFERADVRRWLANGWAVIVTGSKFFGAPPFCGAVLFPAGWPPAIDVGNTPGLIRRWRLALEAIELQPTTTAASLTTWQRCLSDGFKKHAPSTVTFDHGAELETVTARQGILSFDPGLDLQRCTALHRVLIGRGFFIGQPVWTGARSLLRLALGAQTSLHEAGAALERLAKLLRHELAHG